MRKVALVVFDGMGERKSADCNAVKLAQMPTYKYLKKNYPFTTLSASGEEVGLEKGQFGNSEVGHMNMGAGKVLQSDLLFINNFIKSKKENIQLNNVFSHIKKYSSNLHIMGLVSDGGVHSKIHHLFYLLEQAKNHGINNVFIHCFTDGRDCGVNNGVKYIKSLEEKIHKLKVGQIASICGRVWAMDRERRFDRLEKAYNLIANAQSDYRFKSADECLNYFYSQNIFDEFVNPSLINGGKEIQDGDAIVFFNFRTDRAIELTNCFINRSEVEFNANNYKNLMYAGFIKYDINYSNFTELFHNHQSCLPLGKVLEDKGLSQLRLSETTKYAHVTFFFNCGEEKPYKNEDRCLIDSINDKSFEQYPEMRAREITNYFIDAVKSQKYDFILTNISNPDMVGHTGNLQQTIKAMEVCDECMKKMLEVCEANDTILVITADHGNADDMREKNTHHSTSKVPFIIVDKKYKNITLKKDLPISTIAPTVLKLLRLKVPKEYTTETVI